MGTPELLLAIIAIPVILFVVAFGWIAVREIKRPQRNTTSIILILLVVSALSCACGIGVIFLLG